MPLRVSFQAIKIVLEEGTSANYFNLDLEKTLTVKPVGKVSVSIWDQSSLDLVSPRAIF